MSEIKGKQIDTTKDETLRKSHEPNSEKIEKGKKIRTDTNTPLWP